MVSEKLLCNTHILGVDLQRYFHQGGAGFGSRYSLHPDPLVPSLLPFMEGNTQAISLQSAPPGYPLPCPLLPLPQQ